jgi:hypothetical protein
LPWKIENMKEDAMPLDPDQLVALRSTGKPFLGLGAITATPAALQHLAANAMYPAALLSRHEHGDWGNVSETDGKRNDQAVIDGSRVMSSYPVEEKTIWVITEAEDPDGARVATCVLLATEY